MTIERISDNQIRATLTRTDLEDRHIHLAELVPGSDKARELFQDLMQQAYIEHGFEAKDNIPLMIEAIPVSLDSLILVITRVDDPDELDQRLSRLHKNISVNTDPASGEEDGEKHTADGNEDIYRQIMRHFAKELQKRASELSLEASDASLDDPGSEPDTDSASPAKIRRKTQKSGSGEHRGDTPSSVNIYSFPSINTASACCALIEPFYPGESALYRHQADDDYYLVLRRPEEDDGTYDRACRIACDFGYPVRQSDALESYFREHYRTILPEDAVGTLSSLA